MTAKPAPANLWEALSWDDINLWAGAKIAQNRRYKAAVSQLGGPSGLTRTPR